jgi:membrane protease YdiL (CAAX protease family)
MLVLFGIFSIIVGRFFKLPMFPPPRFDTLSMVVAGAILAGMCASLPLRTRLHTPEQRERMRHLRPQTNRDMVWWTFISLAAGIFEEITYRSVIFACFWWYTGSAWAAALISATVFAVSHVLQGRVAVLTIFLLALALQGLCWISGSLYLAMAVHVLYDLFAGFFYQRVYATESNSAGAPAPSQ